MYVSLEQASLSLNQMNCLIKNYTGSFIRKYYVKALLHVIIFSSVLERTSGKMIVVGLRSSCNFRVNKSWDMGRMLSPFTFLCAAGYQPKKRGPV